MHQYMKNVRISIGELAQILNIHPRTLRIYEQENILIPQRSIGNRRLYTLYDIEKAKLIIFLTRNLALNLSGVKIIFAILEKINVKSENCIVFMDEIAKSANIEQSINILKTSKRGRRYN